MKREKTEVWEVVSENLTGLGGPMGTERVTENWRKLFRTADDAKTHAEADYAKTTDGRDGEKIKWKKKGSAFTSGDLRYVMYTIAKLVVA